MKKTSQICPQLSTIRAVVICAWCEQPFEAKDTGPLPNTHRGACQKAFKRHAMTKVEWSFMAPDRRKKYDRRRYMTFDQTAEYFFWHKQVPPPEMFGPRNTPNHRRFVAYNIAHIPDYEQYREMFKVKPLWQDWDASKVELRRNEWGPLNGLWVTKRPMLLSSETTSPWDIDEAKPVKLTPEEDLLLVWPSLKKPKVYDVDYHQGVCFDYAKSVVFDLKKNSLTRVTDEVDRNLDCVDYINELRGGQGTFHSPKRWRAENSSKTVDGEEVDEWATPIRCEVAKKIEHHSLKFTFARTGKGYRVEDEENYTQGWDKLLTTSRDMPVFCFNDGALVKQTRSDDCLDVAKGGKVHEKGWSDGAASIEIDWLDECVEFECGLPERRAEYKRAAEGQELDDWAAGKKEKIAAKRQSNEVRHEEGGFSVEPNPAYWFWCSSKPGKGKQGPWVTTRVTITERHPATKTLRMRPSPKKIGEWTVERREGERGVLEIDVLTNWCGHCKTYVDESHDNMVMPCTGSNDNA